MVTIQFSRCTLGTKRPLLKHQIFVVIVMHRKPLLLYSCKRFLTHSLVLLTFPLPSPPLSREDLNIRLKKNSLISLYTMNKVMVSKRLCEKTEFFHTKLASAPAQNCVTPAELLQLAVFLLHLLNFIVLCFLGSLKQALFMASQESQRSYKRSFTVQNLGCSIASPYQKLMLLCISLEMKAYMTRLTDVNISCLYGSIP